MVPPLTLSLIAKSHPPLSNSILALAYNLQSFSSSPPIIINFVFTLDDNALVELSGDGERTTDPVEVLKRLGDLWKEQGLVGRNSNDSAEISALLLCLPPTPPSFASTTSFLSTLEQRLTLRTFLVGHAITLADWAVWGALKGNSIAKVQLGGLVHSSRWFNYMSALSPSIRAVEDLSLQAKLKPLKAPKEKIATEDLKGNSTFDLGLPNAVMGEVVTRFPPEPSGYLHIGHAKAAILNQYFAKIYKGKFLIRFDDTNPSKEKAEFESSIIEDLAMMGVRSESISYTSDFFDQLHIFAVKLLSEGGAYADDTDQETMRAQRMDGIPSARRDASVEENLTRFAAMAAGTPEGEGWCIRAKISVDNPNKAMRDPVIYRTNLLRHHRTGDKFKIYPTYDFACPIVDCLQGVTHALRTNEYRDRAPQYEWMLNAVGLRRIEIWDYGRMAFVYTLLSKRKLKWFVDEGHVKGWDDPRFATVRGIRRRGLTIEALTQYMLLQGPSQAFTNLEWDGIWNINKKVIDPISPRFVALEKSRLVKVVIRGEGTPGEPEVRVLPKHKKNPDVGNKETVFSDSILVDQEDAKTFAVDEEITLMDWGNAFVRKINTSSDGVVESIEMELHLSGDFKKTKKKITWLSSSTPPSNKLVDIKLLDYDYLITKKRLEDDDDLTSLLTPVTEFSVDAVADSNVRDLKKGDIIQFERKGYYIVDKAFGEEGADHVELILIPDGKASSVASKFAVEKEKKDLAEKEAEKGKKEEVRGKGKEEKKEIVVEKKEVENEGNRLPELAPDEAVETVLLSEGTKGFEQPVKTKMYRVESLYGDITPPVKTEMYKVKPVYDL